jgi:putative dimethyl sulfoxide reductase chaperone
MESISEHITLLENRENLYAFLARLYMAELDQELLDALSNMQFPSGNEAGELEEGYRLIESFFHAPGADPLTDLAVDYARVFLGAGIAEGIAAYPYESVYTSEERLIMQDARDLALAAYRAKGFDKVEALKIPEDHIALELEFMGKLCRESQDALSARNNDAAIHSFAEQKTFLEQHQLNWVPAFCSDIEKCAASDFYKALAKITRAFLRMDHAILEELIAEAAGAQQ